MSFIKSLGAGPLNLLAKILSLNKHVLYYLVTKPLKGEIDAMLARYNGYQHIEAAIRFSKKSATGSRKYVVADVGGGTGTTAEIFSKQTEWPVYIFEPIQANFATIVGKAPANGRWIVINKALGAEAGESFINITDRITSSSILPVEVPDPEKKSKLGDFLVVKEKQKIIIATLDSEITDSDLEIAVMKIDAQGFEMNVLRGAGTMLHKTHVVVLEISLHQYYQGSPTYFEIDGFLREQGFRLADLYTSERDENGLKEWDSIYINQRFFTT